MTGPSPDLEARLRELLQEEGRAAPAELERIRESIPHLPARGRRISDLGRAAVVLVALGLGVFLIAGPRVGGIGAPPATTPASRPASGAAAPTPPDPAAFAGDPRLARCGGLRDEVLYVFEMAQARHYQLHLPKMGFSPELDDGSSALVVVYRGLWPGPTLSAPLRPGQTRAPRSARPGFHDLCVIVGFPRSMTIYGDVSLEGFRAVLTPEELSASPAPTVDPQAEPVFADYPGTPWTDRDGKPVDGHIVRAIRAPEHCGWQSAAFVHLGWPLGHAGATTDDTRQYMRDPQGVLARDWNLPDLYDPSATLPDDAVDTGYRYGWSELWISPTTVDREIYLARPGAIERLPRDPNWIGCG